MGKSGRVSHAHTADEEGITLGSGEHEDVVRVFVAHLGVLDGGTSAPSEKGDIEPRMCAHGEFGLYEGGRRSASHA